MIEPAVETAPKLHKQGNLNPTTMHIVVATALNAGQAEYKNMGDVAMLQVTVTRLSELWPDARIQVLTDSASNLARYCPTAIALSRPDCACWLSDRFFIGRFHRYLPKRLTALLTSLKKVVGFRWPGLMKSCIDLRLKFRDSTGIGENLRSFTESIKTCDAMVVCGSGGFADSCREWNFFILGAMAEAIMRGKMVVMFGQGIGPLSDPAVLSWARHVLPKVQLIALRGTRGDREILESVGVQQSRMITTGDDAVELAHSVPSVRQRDAIGVNLRVAFYSEVNVHVVEEVGSVLHNFARQQHAALLPVPIAFHECANDRETIRRLMAGFDDQSDGGSTLDTPRKIVEQIARCRVVVTGAYHAAVFALSQGIPVIGLSNSSYYDSKFKGLETLFESGCVTIALDDPNFAKKLHVAIEEAWGSADKVRLPLLNSATQQIERGRSAYQSLKSLLERRAQRNSLFDSVRAERVV